MTHPLIPPEAQALLGARALFAADAAIEDAFNPRPELPPHVLEQYEIAVGSGDPVRAGAAEFLMDMYRAGLFKGGDRNG